MLHLDVRWPRVSSLLSLSVEDVILPYLGCVQGLYVMANAAIPSFPRREVAHEKKSKNKKTESAEDQVGSP
jgi:hypothetical protein